MAVAELMKDAVVLLQRFGHQALPNEKASDIESLDYDPIFNAVSAYVRQSQSELRKRRFYGYTGSTFVKWIFTISIGMLRNMC